MAYIVSTTQTATANAATYTVTLGAHVSGDLLLVKVSQDGGGTTIAPDATSATAGWAMIGTQAASGASRSAWAWLIADSASEVNPVFTGATDDWIGTCLVIRDAHATAPFGATPTSGTNFIRSDYTGVGSAASNKAPTGDLTSPEAECLLIYSWNCDGNRYPRAALNEATAADKYYIAGGAISHMICYRQQQAAGVAPTVTMYKEGTTNGGNGWILAVRNKSGGVLQPDVRPDIDEIRWHGSWELTHDSTTWQAPSSFAATINSITCSTTVPTATFSTAQAQTPYGVPTTLAGTESTAACWAGGTYALAAPVDMTGKVFGVQFELSAGSGSANYGTEGVLIGFSDGTNWGVYQARTKAQGWALGTQYSAFIALDTATTYATSGTWDATAKGAITRIGYFVNRATTTATGFSVKSATLFGTTALTGGGSSRPVTFQDYQSAMSSWGTWEWAELNAAAQVKGKSSIQLGDGTNATYFDGSAQSFEFPQAWSSTVIANQQMSWNAGANSVGLSVKAKAADTINLASGVAATDTAQNLSINASSSASATYSFAQSFVGWRDPIDNAGLGWSGATFKECGTVTIAGGGDLTNCTIAKTTSAYAALAITANGSTLDGCTIDGTGAAYALELGTAVTAITLTDCTITAGSLTPFDKVHVLKTTGTVTITISGTTTLASGDVTSEGATVVISAPTYHRGLNFTGLVNGSKVKVFSPGTQTVLFGTDSVTGNAFAFDDSTSGSTTVDYTIQKVGYLPIRATGVALNGSTVEATGRPDTTITQSIDRAYITGGSTGLTYGTTAVVTVGTNPTTNPGTKTFQLGAASTGQNWYSFWIEQWIDKGDDGEALANVEFPLAANGPNSFTLRNGWTFSDGATSIDYLTRDGLRYTDTSGNTTASWCAILTSGAGNKQVRYQQSDGGTTEDGTMVGNEMDQLVQIISDPNGDGNYADGFDRSGYLVLKIQAEGYDQAEANAVTLYGQLEDQLYVVGLTPTANGIATGNPTVTLTLDRGTYNDATSGKTFGVRIVSADSGTDIMRELRYNFGAGGEYPASSGYDGFDWHDLVQTNGSDFKTVRGNLYGSAASKGVVVYSSGTTLHPDFTLFTADDGTTYTPPVVADVSITSMPTAAAATTRLQIINQTAEAASAWVANTVYATGAIVKRTTGLGSESTAGLYFRATTGGTSHATTEPTWDTTVGNTTTDNTVTWTCYAILFYDADPVNASIATTYVDGEEFVSGEVAEIRFAEMDTSTSFKIYDTTVTVSSVGFSAAVVEEADPVYATFAIDGSTFDTTYSPNFVDDYIVLDTNTDFSGASAFAYYCYILTTSAGMYDFWGGVTAIDSGNIRINDSILDMYLDCSSGFVKQTDNVRIFRDDGTRPALDPVTAPGLGIEINWRTPVSVVTTGGSALTPTESAYLLALPSADANATATVAKAVDGTTTLAESLAIQNAILAGKVSGAGTTTETFRDLADTKNRVVVTVDSSGNRSTVVRDGT